MNSRFDEQNAKIDSPKESISTAGIRALSLYVGLAAVMLTVMARGFGWL